MIDTFYLFTVLNGYNEYWSHVVSTHDFILQLSSSHVFFTGIGYNYYRLTYESITLSPPPPPPHFERPLHASSNRTLSVYCGFNYLGLIIKTDNCDTARRRVRRSTELDKPDVYFLTSRLVSSVNK